MFRQWAAERLAAVGHGFLRLYDPNYRASRRTFLGEVTGFAVAALLFYWVTLPLETAEWLSDEAFNRLIPIATLLIDLWMLAFMASCARRAHDIGLSGAWAFFLAVPVLHIIALIFLLLVPGKGAPTGWPFRYESSQEHSQEHSLWR